ncbi:hypothetical protein J2S71_001958 [Olsenella profusa DSM 13989]|nr:hypothetical protein [Olsenella profusa]MDP9860262.1 hypothetical protein [Olsenella profusa DSM 13989]
MTFDYNGSYSGVLTADGESVSSEGESSSATDAGQNVALAQNGGILAITNGSLDKSGDDTNGDSCNFYGLNSILLGVGTGSQINVSSSRLNANSEGSNAIFATDGATVYANDDAITTSAGNSRGLDATYGGTIVANKMDISTQGDHSASVATDRGGGDISLTDSSLQTAGSGSPLLYSTGDIEVNNVTGTATGSQIAGMEGLNTILINNSTLESTITDKTASDPIADGIIIYQSTSGDAESTTGEAASFQAANSTLRSAISSGSMFYLTNTTASIVLSNTTLDFDSSAANLLQAEGNDSNGWGTAGSNGATVTLTGIGQTLRGTISADTISSVTAYLTEGSIWTGAATIIENASATSTSDAPISVDVDGTSTWVVSADSTLTNLTVAEGGKVVDGDGNAVTIVDASGNVLVRGTSDVTVTVRGSYSTSYDASGAGALATETIDRSDFDGQYGTDTDFSMGDDSAQAASPIGPDDASKTDGGSWWDDIVSFFKELLGIG